MKETTFEIWGGADEDIRALRKLGMKVARSSYEGCTRATCQHISHDPAARVVEFRAPADRARRGWWEGRGEPALFILLDEELPLILAISEDEERRHFHTLYDFVEGEEARALWEGARP